MCLIPQIFGIISRMGEYWKHLQKCEAQSQKNLNTFICLTTLTNIDSKERNSPALGLCPDNVKNIDGAASQPSRARKQKIKAAIEVKPSENIEFIVSDDKAFVLFCQLFSLLLLNVWTFQTRRVT